MQITTVLLWFSMSVQAFAAFFALRLIPVSGRARAWIIISLAFLLMMTRRLVGLLYESGVIDRATMELTAEVLALTISIMLAVGVYLIRGIFADLKRAHARLTEQLDELHRFQKVTVGRELRLKEIEAECAALRLRLADAVSADGNAPAV
jgi:hypothetical protein